MNGVNLPKSPISITSLLLYVMHNLKKHGQGFRKQEET